MKIDHASAIPFYIQLRELLEAYILHGEWQPGDQLPPEKDLCETYDVSRTVVRQTLQEMENKGLIIKQRGKGSFVAKPKIRGSLVQKLTGFHQDMIEQGLTPRTEVLHQKIEPAKAAVAMHLNLMPGTLVFNIERVQSVNDEPIVLVRTYLPHALCPGLADVDLNAHSLYATLEDDFGLRLSHGQRTIEAVLAGEREAKYLGVTPGAPLIALESISYLHDGTPIEYFNAFHRGDRSRFVVNLLRVREPEQAKIVVGDDEIAIPNSNNLV
jgi:GntR family transcriptional regulator